MSKFSKSLIIIGLGLTLSACFPKAKVADSERPLLKSFLYQTPDCKLAAMPDQLKLPCGINTNPFLTSAAESLACLVQKGDPISGLALAKIPNIELTEALFAVYKTAGESGMTALHFASAKGFESFKAGLPPQFLNQPESPLILGENLAFILWSDPGGEACQQFLRQEIPRKLQALGLS